jgi:hypothetical protein
MASVRLAGVSSHERKLTRFSEMVHSSSVEFSRHRRFSDLSCSTIIGLNNPITGLAKSSERCKGMSFSESKGDEGVRVLRCTLSQISTRSRYESGFRSDMVSSSITRTRKLVNRDIFYRRVQLNYSSPQSKRVEFVIQEYNFINQRELRKKGKLWDEWWWRDANAEAKRDTDRMALNALHIQSHKTQLILVAVTASLTTAALLTAHSTYTRRAHRKALGEEVSKALAAKDLADEEVARFAHEKEASDPQYAGYDEGLVREQLARNYAFFGEEAMTKIRQGSVAIVGCGGVGSWAAVMLVRSYVA